MTDPDTPTQAAPTSLTDHLLVSVYHQIVRNLRTALPRPPSATQEDLALQLESAITEVASYAPVNAAEANLAGRYVAFSVHAQHCLDLASEAEATNQLPLVPKCHAQATALARQASGQFKMLIRLQRDRQRLERDPRAADRLAWAQHIALSMMAEALGDRAKPQPVAEPPPPNPPAPPPAPQPPAPPPLAEPTEPEPDLELTEAERYVAIYPKRAALIRAAGGMRDHFDFDPPDDDLLQAILTGQGPIFAALDQNLAEAVEHRPAPALVPAE